MSDGAIYIPLLVFAIVIVFLVFTVRGKQVPDRVVGVAAPLAGVILLYLLSDSLSGVLFSLLLIGIGGFAWYRHLRDRARADATDQPT
jgi:hypothetical protein